MIVNERFKSLIPPLSADEKDSLETSLLTEGCRDALVIWSGQIIDGHNRYELCQKHGIAFATAEKQFENEDDACIWIIKNQFSRRNISAYSRSCLALELESMIRCKAKERQKEHGNTAPGRSLLQNSVEVNTPVNAQRELASIAGVSHDTIHKVKAIEAKAPERIKQQARSGEISINQAFKEIKREERKQVIETQRDILAELGKTKETDIDFRLGDFYEVLSDLPDGSIDCIITDPPYPKEYIEEWSKLSKFASQKLRPGGFCIAYSGQMYLPEVMSRLGASLDYYWTFAVYHGGSTQIVNGVNIMCRWKPVLIYQNGKQKLKNTFQDYFISEQREKSEHDWQQSISGVSYLIEMFTSVNDLICDPFAGSGTTIKAAIAKGRKIIACELDERTFNIARAEL